MNYTLNPEAAKAADTMNGRIEETGKYIGIFTRAEESESTKGTKGIEMSYKSNDGLTADYLSLWTVNADGKEIYGYKVLMAVMTCMKTKTLTNTVGKVEKYDQDQQKRVVVDAKIYPELMDKPIGLLLQREEYLKKDGRTIGSKMNIVGAFDPETEMTASEILDRKTKPELLERMVAGLKDKIVSAPKASNSNEPPTYDYAPMPSDDVPF
jgi:hypothetical protein